jgi:hypothetical protein
MPSIQMAQVAGRLLASEDQRQCCERQGHYRKASQVRLARWAGLGMCFERPHTTGLDSGYKNVLGLDKIEQEAL